MTATHVDYRLSHEAPFPAALHDLKAALRYLRRFSGHFGIDAERIGLLGESAGGCLVAMLGVTGSSGDAELEGIEGIREGRTDVAAFGNVALAPEAQAVCLRAGRVEAARQCRVITTEAGCGRFAQPAVQRPGAGVARVMGESPALGEENQTRRGQRHEG